MNRFGRAAQMHWQQHLPSRYAQVPNPEAFFSTLGDQIESEVQDLAATLAGPDPAGEDYLTKVGRLNAARQQAEEAVLSEQAFLSPGNPPENSDEPPSPDGPGTVDEDLELDGPSRLASVQAAIADALHDDR
jgi:hypothetical protein